MWMRKKKYILVTGVNRVIRGVIIGKAIIGANVPIHKMAVDILLIHLGFIRLEKQAKTAHILPLCDGVVADAELCIHRVAVAAAGGD